MKKKSKQEYEVRDNIIFNDYCALYGLKLVESDNPYWGVSLVSGFKKSMRNPAKYLSEKYGISENRIHQIFFKERRRFYKLLTTK